MRECPECHGAMQDAVRFCPHCGSAVPPPAAPPPADPWVGRVVNGKFRVEGLLGQGGMGRVYRAKHLTLDKLVVLKMLHRAYSNDPEVVARFQREARAASRLSHPNSIAVLDFGEAEDGTLFMAMEYLAGRDLARVVAEEFPLGEGRIVRIGAQILSALAEAHAQGVVHRDLKPENVMIEPRRGDPDAVKVLDFGIAKITAPGANEPKLTQAGLVCGTPEYMSPEQARGADLDQRSDLYSMGVILYQLTTGVLPFASDTPVGFLTAHLSEIPVPARERNPEVEVSPALDAVIARALEKDPAQRFQSADEMRDALLACAAAAVVPVRAAEPPAAGRATEIYQPARPEPTAPPRTATPAEPPAAPAPAPGRRSRALFWAFGAAMVLAVVGGGTIVVLARRSVDARRGHPDAVAPAQAGEGSGAAASGAQAGGPGSAGSGSAAGATAGTAVGTTAGTMAGTAGGTAAGTTAGTMAGTAGGTTGAGIGATGATGSGTTGTAAATPAGAVATAVPAATSGPEATPATPAATPPSGDAARGDPAVAERLFRRAEARRAAQDVDGAIALYLQAEAADPGLAEVHKKLALCYQLKGDRPRAAERYRRYLATGPKDADRVRAILSTLR